MAPGSLKDPNEKNRFGGCHRRGRPHGRMRGRTLLWVYVGTAESAGRADDFLASLARGDIHDAYSFTASSFRSEQSEPRFAGVLGRAGITEYGLRSWTDRTLDHDGSNTYLGTISTQSGRTMPFSLKMAREDGEWRGAVLHWARPDRGRAGCMVQAGAGRGRGDTARRGDHERIRRGGPGKGFQRIPQKMGTSRGDSNFSLEAAYEAAYKEYFDEDIDFSGVQNVYPVFDEAPRLERASGGFLLVTTGRFPVEGAPVPFRFRYTYMHPQWKVSNVDVRRPGDPDIVAQ